MIDNKIRASSSQSFSPSHWRVLSEAGKLKAVMIYDAAFSMWGLKLPFSGEHQLCWYTSKNVDYEESRKQYAQFRHFLGSEGAQIFDISEMAKKIIDNATLSEKKSIVEEIWGSKKQRPTPTGLTALHVMRGFPEYPRYENGRIITPDFVRANTYARDIAFVTQQGLIISKMRGYSRREQPKLVRLVAKRDKVLSKNLSLFWDADQDSSMQQYEGTLEGGDVQVISADTIACGIGQQTNIFGFTKLAEMLLREPKSRVRRVVGVKLPRSPASIYMHLDTTICFYDKGGAVVMPYLHESRLLKSMPRRKLLLELLSALRRDLERDDKNIDTSVPPSAFANVGESIIMEKSGSEIKRRIVPSFIDFLIAEKLLDPNKIVLVGGQPRRENDVEHLVGALREQYTQAPNIVCLRPNVVLSYKRNTKTINALRQQGVKVREIPDAYLDLGGGPHCLTMPLSREELFD